MNCRIEDDIVRRALIALLAPEQHERKSEEYRHSVEPGYRGRRRVVSLGTGMARPTPARIFVVDQPSSQTLSVCWSDPRYGHYAAQMWRKGNARRSDVCVLTGAQIRPGDAVFRPHAGEKHAPVNREYMLLASAVPEDASLEI